MRLYRVISQTSETSSWAGSQSDVAELKRGMLEDGAKRKEISVEDVEVPTNKASLILWLNSNCKHKDDIIDVEE